MDNTILDVVLGLVLIYLTLALLVMKVQETVIGRWGRGRAKTLHELIREAVGRDENLKKKVLANPLISALSSGSKVPDERKGIPMPVIGPSSVPPELFARALLIELNDDTKGGHPSGRFASPAAFMAERGPVDAVSKSSKDDAQRIWNTLRGLLAGREADWTGFEAAIAEWFCHIGDRAEGWYQRKSQSWSLRLAILVALLLNVDTFYIAEQLSSDPDLRRSFASLAERVNTLFPLGVQASGGAAAPATAAPAASERAEVRVAARLVDAITRLNDAFFRDKSIASYRPDQLVFNGKKNGKNENGTHEFCKGIDGQLDPTDNKAYLSNPATWILVLPQVLSFIEQQQVLDSSDAPDKPASPAHARKDANLKNAYRCLSRVSVWVRSAISASSDASVRTSIQEASVALESAKSALLELIDNQRPTYSIRMLFKSDPDLFDDCVKAPGASLTSLQACVARGTTGQVRLPIGPLRSNLRKQFCNVREFKKSEAPQPGAVSSLVCGEKLFEQNDRLGLGNMSLVVEGPGPFVLWLLGCLVTAFFVALGAPFWFGLLGKIVNLRAAGRKRDDEDDKRRGQGSAPPPAPVGANSPSGTGVPAGTPQGPGPGPAPFSLARNPFEEQLTASDIILVQRHLGVAATAVLDAPTRSEIARRSRELGEASDELSFTLFDSITGRSPTNAGVTRPSGRLALREVNEMVQPLAKNLMAQLDFPGRIPPAETRFSDDLRALAVLYRYKAETTDPHKRSVVTEARSNRAALDELDPKLAMDILSFTGAAPPAMARNVQAPWLDWAIGELGQVEAGKASRAESNPRVIAYLDTEPGGGDQGDQKAWCGAFAAWVLAQHNAHLPGGATTPVSAPPAAALASGSWCGTAATPWGASVGAGPGVIGNARPGDLVTLKLDGSADINHVAFVLELDPSGNALWAIGGNQARGTCVCVSRFTAAEVADIRRP